MGGAGHPGGWLGWTDRFVPDAVRAAYPAERHLRIPIDNPKIRSLNLAQCAAVAMYEARRQVALSR